MNEAKGKKLIAKYFTDSISASELDELIAWLDKQENQDVFFESAKVDYAILNNMSQYNAKKSEKLLLDKIRKDKNIFYKFKIGKLFKYAAVAILFLSTGYFVYNDFLKEKNNGTVTVEKNAIILQLDDGKIKVLSEDGTVKVVNQEGTVVGSQSGNQLVYNSETSIEKLVYNTLTVPYGKRFELKLSDGTHVFLNAGTSLKYPVKFLKGKNREVFLNGEAFFNVTKNSEHPFIVNMNNVGIRVLGTKFNASSYPENDVVNTVLVEGSVSIFNNNNAYSTSTSKELNPGYMATWDKSNKKITIDKADIDLHTAWMDGRVIFRHMPFKNIIKRLERQYDVTIMNNNRKLDDEFFTASFDIETIEQVLMVFHKNYGINYSILNKQIIIN